VYTLPRLTTISFDFINPTPKYAALCQRLSAHSKASKCSRSHSAASFENVDCGQPRNGLLFLLFINEGTHSSGGSRRLGQ